MKKFVLGLGVFLVAMIVIGIIVFYITRDLPKTVNQFIMEIKNGKYEDAYKYTSSEFQKNVDLESFIQLIENSHIPNNQKINWHSRSIKNGIGDISGNITGQSGSTTPINIQLTKENNLWKIQTINIHSAGIQFDQDALLPGKNEIVQRERNVIMAYKSSFEGENVHEFYNQISDLWKSQISAEEMDEKLFKPFRGEVSFEDFSAKNFVFSQTPYIDENSVMIVEGYFDGTIKYQGENAGLALKSKYIQEDNIWKLVGFHISVN